MSDWHEGRYRGEEDGQALICECVDGRHRAQDMVAYVSSPYTPHPVTAIIADHAKAALLDDAVKALERFIATYKYHDAAAGCLWSCFEADVENAAAILTRLRDVPVHDTKGEA